jgi:hypothetical protein
MKPALELLPAAEPARANGPLEAELARLRGLCEWQQKGLKLASSLVADVAGKLADLGFTEAAAVTRASARALELGSRVGPRTVDPELVVFGKSSRRKGGRS